MKNDLSQARTIKIVLAFLRLRRKYVERNAIVTSHRDFLSNPTNGATKPIRNSKKITRKRQETTPSLREKLLVNYKLPSKSNMEWALKTLKKKIIWNWFKN